MLTIRRLPKNQNGIKSAAVDIVYGDEEVSLILELVTDDYSVWSVYATDWGNERYYPKKIALGNNQPLTINKWLKIYGAKKTENGEAVIHIRADRNAKIERRDRANGF